MKRMISWAAALGAMALFIGAVGASPAKADDDDYGYQGRRHIYRDIADVRRDEARLRGLERRCADERRERDWVQVRSLDRQISDLRYHIQNDRRDIHRDIDRTRRDHDRDDYRYRRDRDDHRDRQ